MARSISKNSKYDVHPGDKSRKGFQRVVNKRTRRDNKLSILKGFVEPVVRRQVDYMAH